MRRTKAKVMELETQGVFVDVHYDYQEAEDMVYNYGDGSGYPGSPASIDIYKVTVEDVDITDIIADCYLEDLEEQLLKWHTDE